MYTEMFFAIICGGMIALGSFVLVYLSVQRYKSMKDLKKIIERVKTTRKEYTPEEFITMVEQSNKYFEEQAEKYWTSQESTTKNKC